MSRDVRALQDEHDPYEALHAWGYWNSKGCPPVLEKLGGQAPRSLRLCGTLVTAVSPAEKGLT